MKIYPFTSPFGKINKVTFNDKDFGAIVVKTRRKPMINLHKEFKDWIAYNFPGEELTAYQEDVMEAILTERIPPNSEELAERLKHLLSKTDKRKETKWKALKSKISKEGSSST